MPPPSVRGPRVKIRDYEMRAQVTGSAHSFLTKQAEELGRASSWHVGLFVEALAAIAQKLTPPQRAQLDVLLRQPEELFALIRDHITSNKS